MALTPKYVFRRYTVDGVPSSGDHKPLKAEVIQLLDGMSSSSAAPAVVKATKAQLDAVTPASENYGGLVLNDPDASKNGYYYRQDGMWVLSRGLPDTFARLNVTGGTANAVLAGVAPGVNPSDVEVFFIEPSTTNTGNVTLSVAGSMAKAVLDVNGNELSAGQWTAGRKILLVDEGTSYRLLSDPDADGAASAAAASAAAAESDRELAEAARAGAESAAAGVTVGLAKARVLSAVNINLAAPGTTIDGQAMANGQTFLATAQTVPAQNGLYVFNGAAVAATRHPVYSTYDSIAGQYFSVLEGAENGDTLWHSTSDLGGILGTTPIALEKYTAALVIRRQIFTSSGTYTPHVKMAYAEIECLGGGGGGGGCPQAAANFGHSAGGGGSGAFSKKIATRSDIGTSQVVTVGAAGPGGSAGNNAGTAGGASSVGALCTAPGGGGGAGGALGAGGLPGSAGVGDLAVSGDRGGQGFLAATNNHSGVVGVGAPSIYGGSPGIRQATVSAPVATGANASSYGAGGNGGASFNASAAAAGGAGSAGIVVITEFCTG